MEEKHCLECGEILLGRSDKKFCSDACRNAYNNRKNQTANKLIRNINNKLKKNWRILEQLNSNDKTKVHQSKLLNAGFDFNHFTSIYTTKKQTVYYFVYDQGYLDIGNGFYMLVKRKTD
jgi:predicted nucleic acid-binding Zn ribbon protein